MNLAAPSVKAAEITQVTAEMLSGYMVRGIIIVALICLAFFFAGVFYGHGLRKR
jgi:hypothetical protein